MDKNLKKIFGFAGLTLFIVYIFSFVSIAQNQEVQLVDKSEAVQFNDPVTWTLIRTDGSVEEGNGHNLVYNSARDDTLGILFNSGSGTNVYQNITLNNASAPTAAPVAGATETNTYFSDCGFQSKGGTYAKDSTTGLAYISAVFTATCDDLNTNVTRLTNVTGGLFAGATFSIASNINTNDQLTMNWTLNITNA